MKKISIVFLVLMMFMVFFYTPAMAESPTIVIRDEDSVKEMKLEELIVVEDLFTFNVENWDFCNLLEYTKTNPGPYYTDYESGSEERFFYVYCRMLNESLVNLTYDKYLSEAKLKFRGKYEFSPVLSLEYLPDEGNFYLDRDSVTPFEPLTFGFPRIIFLVPNLVETSKDSLVLYLTVNGVEYAYRVR